MYFLEDITTQADGHVELETFQLINKAEIMNPMALHRFEWTFGLDNFGFPFNGEENTMTVHKDLIHYYKKRKLAFFPSKSVLGKAVEMMEHNKKVGLVGDRQRFEDFGTGPWEYTLFSTKGRGTLPPLFHHLPDGSTTTLSLAVPDYNSLPRFMSMIHPLVVIFSRELYSIAPSRVDQFLSEHVIGPMEGILLKWPLWTHNRFLPKVTSPKRKRLGTSVTCRCQDCVQWEYSDSSSSSSSSRETRSKASADSESSDDSESWHDPYPVEEVTKDDSRVKNWSRQTEKAFDDHGSDPILVQYSMEASPPVAEILGRLDEAMGLRKERLQLILDAAKPARSERSSRASKRSRRS
ncbi:hypothetical protein AAF712_002947 [Marasmius tenuissimus]|uniref:Uncharacterized protein n=1 Tax=Marasmius tenuissimus TaxID=585030 RepID=A0ABR3A7S6_9AGAR